MKIPELLAPVSSPDYLKVAINAGASSVYLSGKEFGARAYAENFTIDEIEKAVDLAHLHNVKVYVTVNTLIKESELNEVVTYLSELYNIGVDAVIIQDLGLVEIINEYLPDLNIHASTQMTIENQDKLNFIESKKVKRVVLPREMRYDEIESLKTNMEVEIFVHGALCYSYSGQCLMSSFKGDRSGNRGTCAQPCRQKYEIDNINKKDYYLSPCDLNLLNRLSEISNLNIKCVKIEGRMRSKQYLATVVSTYRKALNKLKSKKKFESEDLNLVFNRGFSEGQLYNVSKRSIKAGHIGLKIGRVIQTSKNQIAIKLKDDIENIPEKGDGLLLIKDMDDYGFEISQNTIITSLNHFKKNNYKKIKDLTRKNKVLIVKKVWQNKKNTFDLDNSDVYLTKRNRLSKKVKDIENNQQSFIKHKLTLDFYIKNMFPYLKATLKLPTQKIIECEVKSDTPFEKPLKKTITREMIKNQLLKVDKYPYEISKMNINYDGQLYLPISKINKLRRNLFEKLSLEIINSYKGDKKNIKLNKWKNNSKIDDVSFSYYTNSLNDLKNINNVKRVYLEIPPQKDDLHTFDERHNINYMINFLKEAIEISKTKNYDLIWKWPDICHDKLIKSLNKVKAILLKMNYKLEIMNNNFKGKYSSYCMNVTNNKTVECLNNYKIITLSCELTKKDYEDIITNARYPEKLEILVHGNIELMKTRFELLNAKEVKMDYNNYLIDMKHNKYPIHKSISNEELIIFSDSEISRIQEIKDLKKMGYCNFSIDGRFRDNNYYKIVDKYIEALNSK